MAAKEKTPEVATTMTGAETKGETLIEESVHQEVYGPHNPEPVACFRHEGAGCPRCDGSGFRPRKYCAGCGEPSGRPSKGGKALSPERGAKSWDELRSLPLYCMDCNPGFGGGNIDALAVLEGMGG